MSVAPVLLRFDCTQVRPARWWATANTLPAPRGFTPVVPDDPMPPPYGGRYATPLDAVSRGRRTAP